jgi:hypothetical protein
MDVSVLMISTRWEKIYIYFRPPFEITVVLTKKYKCEPTCVHSAIALGLLSYYTTIQTDHTSLSYVHLIFCMTPCLYLLLSGTPI